jgi:hypothetical protein
MNSFFIWFLLKPHQCGLRENSFFALLFREEFGTQRVDTQRYRLT